MSEALALLTPSLDAGYVSLDNSPAYQQFQAMESQILASTGGTGPGECRRLGVGLAGRYLGAMQNDRGSDTATSCRR